MSTPTAPTAGLTAQNQSTVTKSDIEQLTKSLEDPKSACRNGIKSDIRQLLKEYNREARTSLPVILVSVLIILVGVALIFCAMGIFGITFCGIGLRTAPTTPGWREALALLSAGTLLTLIPLILLCLSEREGRD